MTERNWNVALRAQGESALEIAVYDVIGKDFWGEGISSKDFLGQLGAAPKAKDITLRVNSLGGIVDEGKAMTNLLHARVADGATVTGIVDGIAASMAAYLLTSATKVVMPANAFQMIHGVRGMARGTASEVAAAAELMARTNEQLAEGYAAASARRGKGKTKADFLAAFAKGDTYLDADQAIEWGLADEKLEAVKMAACLADITGIENAPEALRCAPYVQLTNQITKPAPAPVAPQSPIKPGPSATANKPHAGEEQHTMSAIIQLTAIAALLNLGAEATEDECKGAITKLKASAKLGADIEALVGATGSTALGVVKAMKTDNEANQSLAEEVEKLKIVNARRDFEGIRDQGLKDKKLTAAVAKFETDRFEAVLKDESIDAGARAAKATEIAQELKGRLQVTSRQVALPAHPPAAGGNGEAGPVQHNGKSFEDMKPIERHQLKQVNQELYNTMREDAQARGAL